MNDPFTIVDTLSLPEDMPAGVPDPAGPPVLARLPRLPSAAPSPPKAPAPITRVDRAEAIHQPAYLDDAPPADSPYTDAVDPSLATVVTRPAPADPAATIRIDTVWPTEIDGAGQAKSAAVAAATAAPARATESTAPRPSTERPAEPSAPTVAEDPFTTWLIDLESAVLPYSRWIALAAIAAALGLTAVLLRGVDAGATDASAGPRVEIDSSPDESIVLAADGDFGDPEGLPPVWRVEEPLAESADAPLRPLDGSPAAAPPTPPALVAAGPASASPRTPHAQLIGQVHPATPDTAYPRTATVPRTQEGATR